MSGYVGTKWETITYDGVELVNCVGDSISFHAKKAGEEIAFTIDNFLKFRRQRKIAALENKIDQLKAK